MMGSKTSMPKQSLNCQTEIATNLDYEREVWHGRHYQQPVSWPARDYFLFLHCEPKKHQNVFVSFFHKTQLTLMKFGVYCPEYIFHTVMWKFSTSPE